MVKILRAKRFIAAAALSISLSMTSHALQINWMPISINPLPARSGHTAASCPDGSVLSFGGYSETETGRDVVNDLWLFSHGCWKKMQESSERQDGARPGPRLCSSSVVVGGKFILFGGWDPESAGTGGKILDDIWSLDLKSFQWECLSQRMIRGACSRHVACTIRNGNAAIIHTFRCTNSILVYESLTGMQEVQTTGQAPPSLGLHAAATTGNDTIIVFGGALKDGTMLGDTFALDTHSWQWRKVATTGPRPTPRAGACLAAVGGVHNKIIMCCGAERSGAGLLPRSDVWLLDLERGIDGEWRLLESDVDPNVTVSQKHPCPRNAATLIPIGDGLRFLLHGGWHPFKKTFADSFVLSVISSVN